jgi:hypothetical protein
MTNDHCLKGFWPPEAKVAVDLGVLKKLKKPGKTIIIEMQ